MAEMTGPGTGDRGPGKRPATPLRERSHRLIYAAETILIGAPSMTFCLPLLLMGLALTALLIASPATLEWSSVLYIGLTLAAAAGIVAWLVLSADFLFGDLTTLQTARRGWWIALAAGTLAAIAMSWLMLSAGRWTNPLQWLTGPAMAVPAAHLFWLKYGRMHNQPRHHPAPAGTDSRLTANAPLPRGPRSPVPRPGFIESPVPGPGLTESRVPSPGL